MPLLNNCIMKWILTLMLSTIIAVCGLRAQNATKSNLVDFNIDNYTVMCETYSYADSAINRVVVDTDLRMVMMEADGLADMYFKILSIEDVDNGRLITFEADGGGTQSMAITEDMLLIEIKNTRCFIALKYYLIDN